MKEQYDRMGIKRNWPQYEVIKALGQGAFGKVYKIKREYLGDTLLSAVKVIHIPRSESVTSHLKSEGLGTAEIEKYYKSQALDFVKENHLMQQLKGAANIVTTEDCVIEQDAEGIGYTIYIKMELLESFESLLSKYTLGANDIIKVGCDICDALIACEQKHIVHRDIKPENVFVNEFGTYKLGDFGVSREMSQTQTDMTQAGTGMYMAPELFQHQKADKRVDIYSLGIMLYRLGNGGRFPFMEEGIATPMERQQAVIKRLQGQPIPMPKNVDEELGRIILKACAYRQEDRYISAKELKKDLEKWRYISEYQEKNVVSHNKYEYLKNANVGDTIFFGSYQQENQPGDNKTPIAWRVLDKQDENLLLISQFALDCQQYHKKRQNVTWETCSLRRWLNEVFYNNAFTHDEQSIIQWCVVDDDVKLRGKAGRLIYDKVCLLNDEEAKQYFYSNDDRKCAATESTRIKGAYIDYKSRACYWLLRSTGIKPYSVQIVGADGSVGVYVDNVEDMFEAVRPILWINPETYAEN